MITLPQAKLSPHRALRFFLFPFRRSFAVLGLLAAYLSSDGPARHTEIVLMPSTSDVLCEPVFPQWPLQRALFEPVPGDKEEEDDDRMEMEAILARVTVLPNPATFVVGDVVFGGTTANTLSHLNVEAQRKGGPAQPTLSASVEDASRRLELLTRHIIEQRSYYPLFPSGAAPGDAAPLPLEPTKLWHVGMNVTPDVLLLPTSKYGKPAMVKVVGETIVINPGPVARPGAAGKAAPGSFAKLCIFPGENPAGLVKDLSASLDDIDYVPTAATSRVRVDITKLS